MMFLHTRAASNVPACRVTLDGVDLTPVLRGQPDQANPALRRPRLCSLTIAQKRGEEPDRLTIICDDSDGQFAIPTAGKLLHVELGWERGSEVTVGLISKGSFRVDSVSHEGPPDVVTIEASSADMTGAMRVRREEGHHDTTLDAIIRRIAARHNLKPACHPALGARRIRAQAQSRETDLDFIRRLGRENDAVATIKAGRLILSPVGAATTTFGRDRPTLTLRRRDTSNHSYRVDKREEVTGVTATWHDRKSATRKEITSGNPEGARKLRRVHASEDEAHAAAKAEHSRAARAPVSLDLTLSLGRPDLTPGQRVTVTGFKAQIDATKWLISEVSDTINDRGYLTQIKLEDGYSLLSNSLSNS